METIFFLSSLPEDLYQLVLEVFNKYGKLEIKGQKAKTKDLKAGLKTSLDCPVYNFKCLRGDLTNDEIRALLNDMVQRKLSFTELKNEASRIKEVKEVQRQFVTRTGSKNWEEVIQRCVHYLLWYMYCSDVNDNNDEEDFLNHSASFSTHFNLKVFIPQQTISSTVRFLLSALKAYFQQSTFLMSRKFLPHYSLFSDLYYT